MTLRRNVTANFIGQAAASLLSLLLVPLYIQYLGIEAYALVGLLAVIQAWLPLLDFGMTPAVGRELARFAAGSVSVRDTRDLLHTLERVFFAIGLLIALGLALASGFLARDWLNAEHLPSETVVAALSLIGAVVGLRYFESLYRSVLMGLERQVWVNGATVILSVIRSVGVLGVLAWISPTIGAFFLWQALISVAALITFAIKAHRAVPRADRKPLFSLSALRRIRGFAAGVFGTAVLALLLTHLDKIILSKLLPLADFGYYMVASAMVGVLYLLAGPVVLATAPVLVRCSEIGQQDQLSRVYHGAAQLVTVLIVPAALMMMAFPEPLLFAWSGNPVLAEKAGPILAMLAVGTALNAVMQIPYQLQLAVNWTRLALALNLAGVVILVPALLWGVPRYGAVAAAGTWAILNLAYVVIAIPLHHRRLLKGEMRRWYVSDLLVPAAGAAAVVGLAYSVRLPDGSGRAEWLFFLAAVGAAATAAGAVLAGAIRLRLKALGETFFRQA